MRKIGKRVNAGEHIIVSYRNKLTFKLEPLDKKNPSKDPLAGLKKLQAELRIVKVSERYRTGDLKQLYREDMAKKYGIKP